MVHHHRTSLLPQQKSPSLEQTQGSFKIHSLNQIMSYDYYLSLRNHRSDSGLLRLFMLFVLFSFVLLFSPRLFFSSFYSFEKPITQEENWPSLCSNMQNGTVCCDRTALRTDVCYMKGDIRTESNSNSFFLVSPNNSSKMEENIRPYTRKWETSVMSTIDELHLKTVPVSNKCDVVHNVTAVVFSTGGYTGNVYHEFNDGIIPLFITSQKFNKEVVFIILEYHDWWMMKYGYVVKRLSNYPPIDFSNDKKTHCFSDVIVGLKIHDELAIDPIKMEENKTIRDFRNFLDEAYEPRVKGIIQEEAEKIAKTPMVRKTQITQNTLASDKPKLVIISRNGSRRIENEGQLARIAKQIGFNVEILRPKKETELEKMYMKLNSSDVMLGVHGAAMTHFMFMRPGSVFIQIVPLGTDWAAETYYGEPAVKLGLRYINYKILPKESSLFGEYKRDDPVLRDPDSVNVRGWQFTKKVYLDGQNVKLDLMRFRKRLIRAYQYIYRKRQHEQMSS